MEAVDGEANLNISTTDDVNGATARFAAMFADVDGGEYVGSRAEETECRLRTAEVGGGFGSSLVDVDRMC